MVRKKLFTTELAAMDTTTPPLLAKALELGTVVAKLKINFQLVTGLARTCGEVKVKTLSQTLQAKRVNTKKGGAMPPFLYASHAEHSSMFLLKA